MEALQFLADELNRNKPVEVVEEQVEDLAFLADDWHNLYQDVNAMNRLCAVLVSFMQHDSIDVATSATKTTLYLLELSEENNQVLSNLLVDQNISNIIEHNLSRLNPKEITQDLFGLTMTLNLLKHLAYIHTPAIANNRSLLEFLIKNIVDSTIQISNQYAETLTHILISCVDANVFPEFDFPLPAIFKMAHGSSDDKLYDYSSSLINCLCYTFALNEQTLHEFTSCIEYTQECLSVIQRSSSHHKALFLQLLECALVFSAGENNTRFAIQLIDCKLLKYFFPTYKIAKPFSELETSCTGFLTTLLDSLCKHHENLQAMSCAIRICKKLYENDKESLKKLVASLDAAPGLREAGNKFLDNVDLCMKHQDSCKTNGQ